jgi:hypothetical protein
MGNTNNKDKDKIKYNKEILNMYDLSTSMCKIFRFDFKDNTFNVLDVTLDKKCIYLEETRLYDYDRVQCGTNMTLIYHDYDKKEESLPFTETFRISFISSDCVTTQSTNLLDLTYKSLNQSHSECEYFKCKNKMYKRRLESKSVAVFIKQNQQLQENDAAFGKEFELQLYEPVSRITKTRYKITTKNTHLLHKLFSLMKDPSVLEINIKIISSCIFFTHNHNNKNKKEYTVQYHFIDISLPDNFILSPVVPSAVNIIHIDNAVPIH